MSWVNLRASSWINQMIKQHCVVKDEKINKIRNKTYDSADRGFRDAKSTFMIVNLQAPIMSIMGTISKNYT